MRAEVTVGATITEIAPAAENVKGVTRNLSNVIVKNTGNATIYLQWTIESNALTTGNGFPLSVGDAVAISREWGGAPILGITAASNETVRVSGD